jgi:uncharacterized linocin/CFP29 family protein
MQEGRDMNNYGRDEIWDPATWADIDQVVLEEVKRVRVARRVFRTEDVRGPDGRAPSWVSTGQIEDAVALHIQEDKVRPFVELSVRFSLTPAQADAENVLHTARTLARTAGASLAFAEDQIIFRGENAALAAGVSATNTNGLPDVAGATIGTPIAGAGTRAERLLRAVNTGIAALAGGGSTDPYALILGATLYADYVAPLPRSTNTPADRLAPRLKHSIVSGALPADRALLTSLPSESTTIFTALEPLTAFSQQDDIAYRFRVFERFQFATRSPRAIQVLG